MDDDDDDDAAGDDNDSDKARSRKPCCLGYETKTFHLK
jgi:hypothetical protein